MVHVRLVSHQELLKEDVTEETMVEVVEEVLEVQEEEVELVEEVKVVEVVEVEVLVNVVQNQIAPAGPHCVVSGDTVRPQTNLMEIQMLANVPPLQTVLSGLQLAPSGDIARRVGAQTKDLLGGVTSLLVE